MSMIVVFQHFCVCEIFDQEPVFNKKPVTRCTLGPTVQETGGSIKPSSTSASLCILSGTYFYQSTPNQLHILFWWTSQFSGIFYHTFQYNQIVYCQHVRKYFFTNFSVFSSDILTFVRKNWICSFILIWHASISLPCWKPCYKK